MAAILGILDGLQDARQGSPAYFWSFFTNRTQRRALLRGGWKSLSKIFILALVLDAVYQMIVFRRLYPGEALIVATILAILGVVQKAQDSGNTFDLSKAFKSLRPKSFKFCTFLKCDASLNPAQIY